MAEVIIIDSETGEQTSRPMTPEEQEQKAQDEAAWAAIDWPKTAADYQAEWQQLNADLQALDAEMETLAGAWDGATQAQRLEILHQGVGLLNQASRKVNRKLTIVAQSVSRGVWEETEYEEEPA